MAEQATMNLPMDLIQPLLEAKINSAIAEALGAQGQLIMKVVEQIMNQKVNNEGGAPRSYETGMPWLTWSVKKITEEAIHKAINAHLATSSERIQAAIDAEMKKSKSPLVQSMIAAMTKGLTEAASNKYKITVQVAE